MTAHPPPLLQLTVENLKSFGGRHEVPVAPLTLIYGPNSAGKSTLLQSMLLLKQSLEWRGSAGVQTRLVTSGSLIDLGSFASTVHHSTAPGGLAVGIEFSSQSASDFFPLGSPHGAVWHFEPTELMDQELRSIELSWGGLGSLTLSADEASRRERSEPLTMRAHHEELQELLQNAIWTSHRLAAPTRKQLSADYAELTVQRWRELISMEAQAGSGLSDVLEWSLTELVPVPVRVSGELSDETLHTAEIVASELERLGHAFEHGLREVLSRIAYLGPLRAAPERFQVIAPDASATLGTRGEHLPALLHWRPDVIHVVNDWMARLGVPYTVGTKALHAAGETATIGELVSLVLTDTQTGPQSALVTSALA